MWELDHKESWRFLYGEIFMVSLFLYGEIFMEVSLWASKQSIIKGISPEYSLEGLRLKLKLQYFGHLMQELTHWKKYPDAGKDWRQEEKGTTEDKMVGWHHRLAHRSWWWTGKPGVLQSMGLQRIRQDWATDWTEQFITVKDYRLKPANPRDAWIRIQKKICFPLSLSCGFMNNANFPDNEVWKYVWNFCNDTSWPESCVQNLLGLNHVDFIGCLSDSPLISRPSKDRPYTMPLKPSTRVGVNSGKRYLSCRIYGA